MTQDAAARAVTTSATRGAGIRDRLLAPAHRRLITIGLLGGLVAYGIARVAGYLLTPDNGAVGLDARLYLNAGARVLAGGPTYPAWQHAPFSLAQMPELYPPLAVYGLFAPMSLLPAILWWLVPLTIIGAVVVRHRPSLEGWLAIALLAVVWPHTLTAVILGNPVLWVAAAAALGTLWKPAAVLILLKPTLAPFALMGVRSRAWWAAIVILAILAAPGMLDYLDVLRNVRDADPLYSLHDAAIVAIPIVASVTGSRRRARRERPDLEVAELDARGIGVEPDELPVVV